MARALPAQPSDRAAGRVCGEWQATNISIITRQHGLIPSHREGHTASLSEMSLQTEEEECTHSGKAEADADTRDRPALSPRGRVEGLAGSQAP